MTLGSGDRADFAIKHDGVIIYQGVAYKKPGAANVAVKINDICADYLRSGWPGLDTSRTENGFAGLFSVEVGGSEVALVTFYNSYEYGVDGISDEPYSPGSLIRKEVAVGAAAMWITPEGQQYFQNVEKVTDAAQSVGPLKVTQCVEWVLYYTDRFGSWAWLDIHGEVHYREDYSRTQAKREYDNSDPEARGAFDILNEVSPAWDLNTGWLTDEQAAKMGHLLGSVDAMLVNVKTGEVFPVSISGNYEQKMYRQEMKLINYRITAALAQDRIRR